MVLARIQLRRDTAAKWTSADTTLSSGETGVETDTGRFKIGDGATAWTDLPYEADYVPTGTRATPTSITATGGITANDRVSQCQFIAGDPGNVTITVNPQVSAGTVIGQSLLLQGTSDAAKVTIQSGNGLELNGPCVLKNGSRILLVWDGTVWGEVARNDI